MTSGLLRCDGDSPGVGAVSFESGGSVVAVNGTAKDTGMADIGPIWADNPAAAGLKLHIGPLIDAGLALC